MSEYPATLGDLTEVETRLDARLTRVEKRQEGDAEVTDEKINGLRERVAAVDDRVDTQSRIMFELVARVTELERLWAVALENPDLIRELAAQALKGRTPL